MRVETIANNQLYIYSNDGVYFQSYDSVVGYIPNDSEQKVRVGSDWDYSRTTMKYVGQFLGQNTAKTRKDIKNGDIILDDSLYVGAKKSRIKSDIKQIVEDEEISFSELFKELKELKKELEIA